MAGECFELQAPYLSMNGYNDLKFNKELDLQSNQNTVSLPLLAVDQIPVGVFQISGRLSTHSVKRPQCSRIERTAL